MFNIDIGKRNQLYHFISSLRSLSALSRARLDDILASYRPPLWVLPSSLSPFSDEFSISLWGISIPSNSSLDISEDFSDIFSSSPPGCERFSRSLRVLSDSPSYCWVSPSGLALTAESFEDTSISDRPVCIRSCSSLSSIASRATNELITDPSIVYKREA